MCHLCDPSAPSSIFGRTASPSKPMQRTFGRSCRKGRSSRHRWWRYLSRRMETWWTSSCQSHPGNGSGIQKTRGVWPVPSRTRAPRPPQDELKHPLLHLPHHLWWRLLRVPGRGEQNKRREYDKGGRYSRWDAQGSYKALTEAFDSEDQFRDVYFCLIKKHQPRNISHFAKDLS